MDDEDYIPLGDISQDDDDEEEAQQVYEEVTAHGVNIEDLFGSSDSEPSTPFTHQPADVAAADNDGVGKPESNPLLIAAALRSGGDNDNAPPVVGDHATPPHIPSQHGRIDLPSVHTVGGNHAVTVASCAHPPSPSSPCDASGSTQPEGIVPGSAAPPTGRECTLLRSRPVEQGETLCCEGDGDPGAQGVPPTPRLQTPVAATSMVLVPADGGCLAAVESNLAVKTGTQTSRVCSSEGASCSMRPALAPCPPLGTEGECRSGAPASSDDGSPAMSSSASPHECQLCHRPASGTPSSGRGEAGEADMGAVLAGCCRKPAACCCCDVPTRCGTVHEVCAVWATRVAKRQGKDASQGLKSLIVAASSNGCDDCHQPGATLLCGARECARWYHYPCAWREAYLRPEGVPAVLCWEHAAIGPHLPSRPPKRLTELDGGSRPPLIGDRHKLCDDISASGSYAHRERVPIPCTNSVNEDVPRFLLAPNHRLHMEYIRECDMSHVPTAARTPAHACLCGGTDSGHKFTWPAPAMSTKRKKGKRAPTTTHLTGCGMSSLAGCGRYLCEHVREAMENHAGADQGGGQGGGAHPHRKEGQAEGGALLGSPPGRRGGQARSLGPKQTMSAPASARPLKRGARKGVARSILTSVNDGSGGEGGRSHSGCVDARSNRSAASQEGSADEGSDGGAVGRDSRSEHGASRGREGARAWSHEGASASRHHAGSAGRSEANAGGHGDRVALRGSCEVIDKEEKSPLARSPGDREVIEVSDSSGSDSDIQICDRFEGEARAETRLFFGVQGRPLVDAKDDRFCFRNDQKATMEGRAFYDYGRRLMVGHKYFTIECNERCVCGDRCTNRVVQRGLTKHLEMRMTANKGWGVFTRERIQQGEFVVELVGEVIPVAELERRKAKAAEAMEGEEPYDSRVMSIDGHLDAGHEAQYVIDTTEKANIAAFINHGCTRWKTNNLETHPVLVQYANMEVHRVAFFASRDINAKEELLYDYYDEGSVGQDGSQEVDEDRPKGIKCVCHEKCTRVLWK
eukprot:jgi/Mesvir1/23847/Mv10650-RA.1